MEHKKEDNLSLEDYIDKAISMDIPTDKIGAVLMIQAGLDPGQHAAGSVETIHELLATAAL